MKTRQDAWTEEDDLLLAETVLRHVREGSTQLNAFEEVGDKLNRTSAACGFRWNAVVRHNYEKALQLAKKQRKQRHRLLGKEQGGKKKLLYSPPVPASMSEAMEDLLEQPPALNFLEEEPKTEQPLYSEEKQPQPTAPVSSSLQLEDVIAFLQSMNKQSFHNETILTENERLKGEIRELKNELYRYKNMAEELQHKIATMEESSETIQEDYETMMKIMNRARKLVLLEEEAPQHNTKFKMDRNGNLEKVAE